MQLVMDAPAGFKPANRRAPQGFTREGHEKRTNLREKRVNQSYAAKLARAKAIRNTEKLGPRVCGAPTKSGGDCQALPAEGHERCRHHEDAAC